MVWFDSAEKAIQNHKKNNGFFIALVNDNTNNSKQLKDLLNSQPLSEVLENESCYEINTTSSDFKNFQCAFNVDACALILIINNNKQINIFKYNNDLNLIKQKIINLIVIIFLNLHNNKFPAQYIESAQNNFSAQKFDSAQNQNLGGGRLTNTLENGAAGKLSGDSAETFCKISAGNAACAEKGLNLAENLADKTAVKNAAEINKICPAAENEAVNICSFPAKSFCALPARNNPENEAKIKFVFKSQVWTCSFPKVRNFSDVISHICEETNLSPDAFYLETRYPKRVLDSSENKSIEELLLYPSSVLYINEISKVTKSESNSIFAMIYCLILAIIAQFYGIINRVIPGSSQTVNDQEYKGNSKKKDGDDKRQETDNGNTTLLM